MKTICMSLCLMSGIIISCGGHKSTNDNQKEIVQDTIIKMETDTIIKQDKGAIIPLSIEALQGIWALNKDENALFFIKNDSLYYTEDQSNPVSIKLNGDTFVIMGDLPAHCKVLRLTKDSLWYIDKFTDTPTKLYKR